MIKKFLKKFHQKSFIKIFSYIWRFPFFHFYKSTFKYCRKIYISGEFQIIGKQYMEFESFSAGSRIRIDAIERYHSQKFNPYLKIGKNFVANDDIHIACNSKIIIGNDVLFGSNIYITDHDHGIYSGINCSYPIEKPVLRELTTNSHIIIGDNVFVGEYVTILKGVIIGEGCIIGSNSLVSKSVPPFSIIGGNPAKVIKVFNKDLLIWERV